MTAIIAILITIMSASSTATTTTTSFNLKEYQKDAAFGPDKANAWKYTADKDWCVLSHKSMRGEIEELTLALQAILPEVCDPQTKKDNNGGDDDDSGDMMTTIPKWKLESFYGIWKYHDKHVRDHHNVETKVLQPFMETRVKIPEKVSM